MLYEVQAVFYADDHPAFNEPCDTILSCILEIRLLSVGVGNTLQGRRFPWKQWIWRTLMKYQVPVEKLNVPLRYWDDKVILANT